MNKLNVFKPDYCPWRYPSNWIKNIRLFGRQFKWAYQRITQGYCDFDWWDMDTYLTMLMADMIDELAKKSHGYPGNKEFPTPESWENYLNEIVAKLRYSLNDLPNEYEEAWIKTWENKEFLQEKTPEEKEITHKFLDKEISNWGLRDKALFEALDMIKHVYHNLWD